MKWLKQTFEESNPGYIQKTNKCTKTKQYKFSIHKENYNQIGKDSQNLLTIKLKITRMIAKHLKRNQIQITLRKDKTNNNDLVTEI